MLARRGQLGWIFMCLAVISLTIAAFFILASFSRNTERRSEPFAQIASDSLYAHDYATHTFRFVVLRALRETAGDASSFRARFEERFVARMNEYDSNDPRFGTFFKDVTERKTYSLMGPDAGGVYTLTLPNVQQTTRSSRDSHTITRTFTLEVRFTREGLL